MSIWFKNDKLIEMVKEHSVTYGDFNLSSGLKSNYFVDLSKVLNRSDGLDVICESIFHFVKSELKLNIDAIGGPALGVSPLIGGTLIVFNRNFYGQALLNGFLVRKEDKKTKGQFNSLFSQDYYQRSLPEGFIEGNLKKKDKVLMVEDVVTTGEQLFKACKIVEMIGAEVVCIISVLDRLNGAKEKLGDKYHSMLTIEDLKIVP